MISVHICYCNYIQIPICNIFWTLIYIDLLVPTFLCINPTFIIHTGKQLLVILFPSSILKFTHEIVFRFISIFVYSIQLYLILFNVFNSQTYSNWLLYKVPMINNTLHSVDLRWRLIVSHPYDDLLVFIQHSGQQC